MTHSSCTAGRLVSGCGSTHLGRRLSLSRLRAQCGRGQGALGRAPPSHAARVAQTPNLALGLSLNPGPLVGRVRQPPVHGANDVDSASAGSHDKQLSTRAQTERVLTRHTGASVECVVPWVCVSGRRAWATSLIAFAATPRTTTSTCCRFLPDAPVCSLPRRVAAASVDA
eukprot:108347-Chlamydomonas_euryale.AAC.10